VKSVFILLFCLCGMCGTARADRAGYPLLDVPVLDAIELRGPWLFMHDREAAGVEAEWYAVDFKPTGWASVNIPAVWDQERGQVKMPVEVGKGWFRYSQRIPVSWTNAVTLSFLGVQFIADVWVNGEYIDTHRGGYTPFSFDVTKWVSPGADAVVTVFVSNELTTETVPKHAGGWQNYGGLTREVFLLHQPAIRPVRITPLTSLAADGSATLALSVVFNKLPPGMAVEAGLLDDGRPVIADAAALAAEGDTCRLMMHIDVPRLWSPASPHRYTLKLKWPGGTHAMPLGLRALRLEGENILINGAPIWLQGFGLHEDYPASGCLGSSESRRQDLVQMKRIFNANAIRTGHYPHHPETYNLCDELGIVAFAEIPAWQVSQHCMESDATWNDWLRPQLEEMALTLQQHPSVICWSVSNEIGGLPRYFRRSVEYLHALDPSRPVTGVLASAEDVASIDVFDLGGRNFHYGWYHSTEVYAATNTTPRVLERASGKPVWVAEIGGLTSLGRLGGGYSDQSRGTETYLDRILRFNFQYHATLSDQIAGICVWTWSDFRRADVVTPHGILSMGRTPKLASYNLCNVMRGSRRAFIVERNSAVRQGGAWNADIWLFNPERLRSGDVSAEWTLTKGTNVVVRGRGEYVATGDRAQRLDGLVWEAPANAAHGLYTCWLTLKDGETTLSINSSLFDLGGPSAPGMLAVPGLDGVDDLRLHHLGLALPVYPLVGCQIPLEAGQYPVTITRGAAVLVDTNVTIEAAAITTLSPTP